MTEQISNNRNMFLVIAFFFSEIFHIHKSRSLVKDGYGYVLKITDSLLLSFCTQGFARSCRIQKWIEGILLVDFSTPT